MLTAERDRTYLVYPPGIEFWYRWDDLDILLSHAMEVLSTKPQYADFEWDRFGYPETIMSCHFLDGASGGGIIRADVDPGERWIGGLLLTHEVDSLTPRAMLGCIERFPFHVTVLQPRNVPFEPRIKGSNRFSMLEGATAEHLPSTKDNVYWLATCTTAKVLEPVIERVVDTAAGFRLTAEPLEELPPELKQEAAALFKRGGPHTVSFRVTGIPQEAGMNFSMMLYVGLCLRRRYGIRIRTMHLLAMIEGAPTAWC